MGHVELSGVRYELPDGRVLLDDVSFRVGEGAKIALVGANGVGKTTLLRIISGELAPHGGAVTRTGGLGVMRQLEPTDQAVHDLLLSVANNIMGKTLCAFGDAAATPVLTTVKMFRAEYEAHIREGRCTVPASWRSPHRSMAAAH